jgi:hypothetical protein
MDQRELCEVYDDGLRLNINVEAIVSLVVESARQPSVKAANERLIDFNFCNSF